MTTESAIKAICWDVGGVFTGTPHAAIAALAAEHDIAPTSLSDAVFGSFAVDSDHPWHRLERGEIPLREGWELIESELAGVTADLTLRDVFRRISAEGGDRSDVAAVVREAHDAGVLNAVITNNVREFADMGEGRGWQRLVPLDLMQVVTDSSAVGIRKPDPEIYRLTLAELGVEASDAVFVDDTPINVEAAEAIGMCGVVVEPDHTAAVERIRQLLRRR